MRVRILSAVLIVVAAFPLAAIAQQPSPGSAPLQSTVKQKRDIVLPRPPMETVEQDAKQAEEKLLEDQKMKGLVEQSQPPTKRRPDLDYSVTNGIQGQSVDRALRSQGKLP